MSEQDEQELLIKVRSLVESVDEIKSMLRRAYRGARFPIATDDGHICGYQDIDGKSVD